MIAAERIMDSMRKARVETDEGVINFTVSMGLSSVDDVQTNDAEDLIRLADRALYEAKRLGRDQIVVFTDNLSMEL
jgi:diguanylate cyclase (GGDEF)-like protein